MQLCREPKTETLPTIPKKHGTRAPRCRAQRGARARLRIAPPQGWRPRSRRDAVAARVANDAGPRRTKRCTNRAQQGWVVQAVTAGGISVDRGQGWV